MAGEDLDARVDAAIERFSRMADIERQKLQAAIDSSLDAADRIIMRKAANTVLNLTPQVVADPT